MAVFSPFFLLHLSKGQYKKAIASLHHLAALQGSLPQPQITGQGTLEHQRALIQLATCHFALGEYRVSTVYLARTLRRTQLPWASSFSLSGFLILCMFTLKFGLSAQIYYLICWKIMVILFFLIFSFL